MGLAIVINLPTGLLAPGGAPQKLAAKRGILRGSSDIHGGFVWLETGDGSTLQVIWPYGFRARFSPLELLNADGEVIAREGDFIKLGGGYRPADGDDTFIHHWIPGLDEAFVAHTAQRIQPPQ